MYSPLLSGPTDMSTFNCSPHFPHSPMGHVNPIRAVTLCLLVSIYSSPELLDSCNPTHPPQPPSAGPCAYPLLLPQWVIWGQPILTVSPSRAVSWSGMPLGLSGEDRPPVSLSGPPRGEWRLPRYQCCTEGWRQLHLEVGTSRLQDHHPDRALKTQTQSRLHLTATNLQWQAWEEVAESGPMRVGSQQCLQSCDSGRSLHCPMI